MLFLSKVARSNNASSFYRRIGEMIRALRPGIVKLELKTSIVSRCSYRRAFITNIRLEKYITTSGNLNKLMILSDTNFKTKLLCVCIN